MTTKNKLILGIYKFASKPTIYPNALCINCSKKGIPLYSLRTHDLRALRCGSCNLTKILEIAWEPSSSIHRIKASFKCELI